MLGSLLFFVFLYRKFLSRRLSPSFIPSKCPPIRIFVESVNERQWPQGLSLSFERTGAPPHKRITVRQTSLASLPLLGGWKERWLVRVTSRRCSYGVQSRKEWKERRQVKTKRESATITIEKIQKCELHEEALFRLLLRCG